MPMRRATESGAFGSLRYSSGRIEAGARTRNTGLDVTDRSSQRSDNQIGPRSPLGRRRLAGLEFVQLDHVEVCVRTDEGDPLRRQPVSNMVLSSPKPEGHDLAV